MEGTLCNNPGRQISPNTLVDVPGNPATVLGDSARDLREPDDGRRKQNGDREDQGSDKGENKHHKVNWKHHEWRRWIAEFLGTFWWLPKRGELVRRDG